MPDRGASIVAPLPDPFRMADGGRVASTADWRRRRDEIAALLLENQYGTMPGSPHRATAYTGEWLTAAGDRQKRTDRLVFSPAEENPSVTADVEVTINLPSADEIAARRAETPAFGADGLPAVLFVGHQTHEALLSRGYVVINYPNDAIEPMEIGRPVLGPVRTLYRELYGDRFSWGSIATWAWGAIRVLDHLVELPEIDPSKIAITGHSRNGKTALLAGALDERFGVVNPAGSGCAGAGSYLVLGPECEDLAALTDRARWRGWTAPGFDAWAARLAKLPFDQHFLMGLVAPRPLLRTEGVDDAWANPIGSSATYLATQPIYDFLGVSASNMISYRAGGHAQTEEDAATLAMVCDEAFYGVPRSTTLDQVLASTPDPDTMFEWSAPPLGSDAGIDGRS